MAEQRIAITGDMRTLQQAARGAQKRGDWREAIDLYTACIDRFPANAHSARWRNAIGLALLELGQLDGAGKIFRTLEADHPDMPWGWIGNARLAQKRRDWPETIARLDTCIARFPDHESAFRWRATRAQALGRLGRWREAYEAWDVLAREDPENPDHTLERARSHLEWVGPTAAVRREVEALLETRPNDPSALLLHALVAEYSLDYGESLTRYLRCVSLNTDNLEAYAKAMHAASLTGDADAAASLIATAPPALALSQEFRCRVTLAHFRSTSNWEAGLAIIAAIDRDTLDLRSARGIAGFYLASFRYDLLLEFTKWARDRFYSDTALVHFYLLATHGSLGQLAFEREKQNVLRTLTPWDADIILQRLSPTLLSTEEARRVLELTMSSDWPASLRHQQVIRLLMHPDAGVASLVGDRIRAGADIPDRLLASLLIHATEDRRRVESANLGGVAWADFEASKDQLRRETSALLDEARAVGDAERNIEAASNLIQLSTRFGGDWINSDHSYAEAASFAKWLQGRIQTGQPTSFLRLGDGEGAFLPYPESLRAHQTSDLRAMQQIWWGEQRIPQAAQEEMTKRLAKAVSRCDAVGVPDVGYLIAEMRSKVNPQMWRKLTSVINFVESIDPKIQREQVLVSTFTSLHLHIWDLYRQIFSSLDSVSVVSCHDLKKCLSVNFGLAVRYWYPVPPEHRFAALFGNPAAASEEPFYPGPFHRIMETLSVRPGEVCLVAAGVLGKLICDRVRELGGIGIDIGSVADWWAGHHTGRNFRGACDLDISSSLIKGQPFVDQFDPGQISRADPCRSDRTRRRNLTPAFAPIFANDAAPGPFRIRAIGHPRCGSSYLAEVLKQLGLDVEHERLGRDGLVSWIHTVDDLEPPFGAPRINGSAFQNTIAFVRNPLKAIPSIILEDCQGASFDFRRFHIARRFGVDIARLDNPLSRATASYIHWMRIVDEQEPSCVIRVESALGDLERNAAVLEKLGITFDAQARMAVAAVPKDINTSGIKFAVAKPKIEPENYQALPMDLVEGLDGLCEKYGYPKIAARLTLP